MSGCHGKWQILKEQRPGTIPPTQPGPGQPGTTGAAPDPGIEHLHGEGDRLRLGQDVGPQVGARQ